MSEYTAKDIRVAPIKAADANTLVKRVHYSGKVVQNSQLHLGVFLGGRLEGVMQFGPSLDKRKIQGLVKGTLWNGFIELNRMAFSERLPRNSESRAIGIAMRLIRKHYPHIEWVISFADGTQCGDGTIYRASGFVLTGFSEASMVELPEDLAAINGGKVAHRLKIQDKCSSLSREVLKRTNGKNLTNEKYVELFGGRILPGFMFRYLYFLNPAARDRLTVPILPFSKIAELGAGMYRGEKTTRTKRQESENPSDLGGSTPTCALHHLASEAGDGSDQEHGGGATPTQTLQLHDNAAIG